MKNLTVLAVIFCFRFSFAQRSIIKGTVTDQKNEPIPFASISVANSNLGTAADADGNFSFELPTGSYILRARSMGYRSNSLHITLSPKEVQTLQFVLVEKDEALQEVEVFGNRFERPDKIETLTGLPLNPYEQIQSISIISEKVIEQQENLTIADATRNVPGVYTFATYGNKRESMSSRGFRGIPILKNGVHVHSDFRGVGILTDDWSSGAVTHQGTVPNQEPFNVEAYTLVNMQTAYRINPHWTVRLPANNVFDEIGYNAYRTSYINQTDPRNFVGVLTYTF